MMLKEHDFIFIEAEVFIEGFGNQEEKSLHVVGENYFTSTLLDLLNINGVLKDFFLQKDENSLLNKRFNFDYSNILGKKDPDKIYLLDKRKYKESFKIGDIIYLEDIKRYGKVIIISGNKIYVDTNHPLAGKKAALFIKNLEKINEEKKKIYCFLFGIKGYEKINSKEIDDFKYAIEEKNIKIYKCTPLQKIKEKEILNKYINYINEKKNLEILSKIIGKEINKIVYLENGIDNKSNKS